MTPTDGISKDVQDHVLQIKAATMSDTMVRLYLRRKCIRSDFTESRSIVKFHPLTKRSLIVFVGESAIDDGGPRREFLTLIIFI